MSFWVMSGGSHRPDLFPRKDELTLSTLSPEDGVETLLPVPGCISKLWSLQLPPLALTFTDFPLFIAQPSSPGSQLQLDRAPERPQVTLTVELDARRKSVVVLSTSLTSAA